jgi:mono/diheme cytochrome c family protein
MRRIGQGVLLLALVAGVIATDEWGLGYFARAADTEAPATEVPATNPLSGNQAAIQEGRSWFRATCTPCHGGRADGQGERGHGADLRVFNKGFRKFVETVKNGKETGLPMKMPRWGGVLSDETIYQIGAYLETVAIEGANYGEGTQKQ